MTVRPATDDDVDACVELHAAVVDEGRWLGAAPPVDRAGLATQLRGRIADERSTWLVAEDEGRLVGQASVVLAPFGVAHLGMAVAADRRRRGVGRALLDAAVGWARSVGAHKVSLEVWPHNEAARALYRAAGFVEEGRLVRHYRRRDGSLWDAVVMGLALDDGSDVAPA